MPTGNQNYTSANLMSQGIAAAPADSFADSIQSNVTAVGTNATTAATSLADIVLIGSAATGNTGFKLRQGAGFKRRQVVINMGPGTATIYPPNPSTLGTINNAASTTLASGVQAVFNSVDAAGNQYWKL